jgi:hypothetical protein
MPAIRDWSYNYLSTAATSVICDAPETQAGDLIIAALTCKTAPNTAAAPAAAFDDFNSIQTYWQETGFGAVTMYLNPSSGISTGTADGATNLPSGVPSATTTFPVKSLMGFINGATGSYYAPATLTVATTIIIKSYSKTYITATDLSAITFSMGARLYNATDQWQVSLYSHDPVGAAGNKTIVATGIAKFSGTVVAGAGTTSAITQVQTQWLAADFTITGTGRIPAGNKILAEVSIIRVGATTTAPRIYFDTTGVTTSTTLIFTSTAVGTPGLIYDNITAAAINATASDWWPISALTPTIQECIYFGKTTTFTNFAFTVATAGAGGTAVATWEYWNGTAWATLTTLTDTTVSWRTPTGAQSATWTAPANWATTAVNGSTYYWIRIRVSTVGTFTTRPVFTRVTQGTSVSWTQLYNVVNTTTPAQIVFYRYARATEDATFTFTITSSIMSMAIISIRDVHPTTPFNNGTGYATALNALIKANMPTRTTTVNNCLNLHLVSTSVATVPSIIEGPVTMLYAKDGGTCSDGCGWSITPIAGTTPTVGMSRIAASADVLATISIQPPTEGASVVPTYCASDLSQYLDPINGTTAYNGNTAFAATAVTHYGTLLNTKTLANGTAAAYADSGINSYHSMGQVTSGTTKGTWSGNTLVFAVANKPNVTGENILIHAKPMLAVDLQTTVGIGGTGVCGVAIGLGSTANVDYKVYHVSGGGTPWGANYQPTIINTNYTGAGLIQNTGTLNPASINSIGFFVAGFLTAADWIFGSAWSLDVTTVAGGNAAEPVTPAEVARAAADGHERMSITRQGTNQILVFQPIQFGNGGTNPIYLDFTNAATEFPKQYDQASKTTNYCAPDDVCGYTFYPGAGDVINISGASFSSPSKFHWKFHASSNVSTSVITTTGAAVTGAGTVQLIPGITFSNIAFSKCNEIASNGATITGTSFTSTVGTGALSIASSAHMTLVSNCSFSSNSTYGILLTNTTAESYNFVGIKFSGNTKDIYVAATTGTVTINISGGGGVPTYTSAGATVVSSQSNSFSISNIVYNSEVRIFNSADSVEIAGVENIGVTAATGGTVSGPDANGRYTFTISHPYSSNPVFIVVNCITDLATVPNRYNFLRQDYTINNSTQNLPVVQILDRNFSNP